MLTFRGRKSGSSSIGTSALFAAIEAMCLEHHLRNEPACGRADDHKRQARSHVAVVKHKAAQTSGTRAVKRCATDLCATGDHKVTIAGSPNAD